MFPVAQCVNADAQSFGELLLREANESAQGSHIARLELPQHDPSPLHTGQCAAQFFSCHKHEGRRALARRPRFRGTRASSHHGELHRRSGRFHRVAVGLCAGHFPASPGRCSPRCARLRAACPLLMRARAGVPRGKERVASMREDEGTSSDRRCARMEGAPPSESGSVRAYPSAGETTKAIAAHSARSMRVMKPPLTTVVSLSRRAPTRAWWP